MKKFSSIMRGSSRRTSRNKKLLLLIKVGVISLLLILIAPRVLSFTASLVLVPIVTIEEWFRDSGSTLPTYFRDRNHLLEIQQNLEQKIADESGSVHTIQRLTEENDELRKALGASTTVRIGAGVVGRPTELPYDVFLIDKGEEQGVRELAPVFVGRDQVVGFVAQVYQNTSVVALVTTPGFESTVYIYGPNIYTTALGIGGGTLRVHVPQGIALEEGNIVAMPSFDAGVYGTVSLTDTIPTRPEQFGYVSIDTPLQSIRFVSVGTVPLESISFEEAKEVVERIRTDILSVPVPSGVLVDTEHEPISSSTASTTAEAEESL